MSSAGYGRESSIRLFLRTRAHAPPQRTSEVKALGLPVLFGSRFRALAQQVAMKLMVDAHQRTTVPGLFAAGDVVLGLDQISHAMGEAGVAATAIRGYLSERKPLYR